MYKFGFWNCKNIKEPLIADLIAENDLDLILLCEHELSDQKIQRQLLTKSQSAYFSHMLTINNKMMLLSKFFDERIEKVFDDGRVTIREITFSDLNKILFVGVHLPSKMYKTLYEQAVNASTIREKIDNYMESRNNSRIIIMGDFNMDPFEPGMVASNSFNSTMDPHLLKNLTGKNKPQYYNPMWQFYSGLKSPTYGTYYYNTGSEISYYWHIFDQILLSHHFMEDVVSSDIRVVNTIGKINLLNKNDKPDKSNYSDHLPIVYSFEL